MPYDDNVVNLKLLKILNNISFISIPGLIIRCIAPGASNPVNLDVFIGAIYIDLLPPRFNANDQSIPSIRVLLKA